MTKAQEILDITGEANAEIAAGNLDAIIRSLSSSGNDIDDMLDAGLIPPAFMSGVKAKLAELNQFRILLRQAMAVMGKK